MNIGVRERNLLIKMVIVFIITVVVPGYLSGWADVFRQDEVNRRQSLETEQRDLRAQLSDVAEQTRLYASFQEGYEEWRDRGVVVTETLDTTAWRNVMYDIKQRRGLGVIDFSFGEGQRVPTNASVYTQGSTTNIEILPMRVAMSMLHGMDIFMFLGDLADRADGIFIPLSCRMTRLNPGFEAVLRDNVRGECEVVWVLVYDPEGGSA